jgi:hypothetical protein
MVDDLNGDDDSLLLDAASATAEQRFSLMLHDRIVKLEADNARLMALMFPPPNPEKVVPEFARPLLERLKNIRQQQDRNEHLIAVDGSRDIIPSDVLADIPANALDNALELAKKTKSNTKHFTVFYNASRLIEDSGARTTQRMVGWIETIVAENLAKLDGSSPAPFRF